MCVDLLLYTGSGFGSKMSYGSGLFHLRIKVPDRNSAGVVTAYYVSRPFSFDLSSLILIFFFCKIQRFGIVSKLGIIVSNKMAQKFYYTKS